MHDINPYAAPTAIENSILTAAEREAPRGILGQLQAAARLFARDWIVYCVSTLVIWVPCGLISAYADFFVYAGEELQDIARSYRLMRALEVFFGIIASAAVIHAGNLAMEGFRPTILSSLEAGLRCWFRMWWTNFLTALVILFGLLLLIIPGLIAGAALNLAEQVVVSERRAGFDALKRSWELTKSRLGHFLALGTLLVLLPIAVAIPFAILTELVPELDHWLFDAAMTVGLQLVMAYGTLVLLIAYRHQLASAEQESHGWAAK